MYRVIALVLAGFSLSGCASFSFNLFTPTPPTVTIQLESVPPGADATTSVGPGCKTPCSLAVTTADNFSVTFNLNRFMPETVPVQLIRQEAGFGAPPLVVADPNPIVIELKPAKPVRQPPKRRVSRRAAPPPGDDAPPPPRASSPFPNPR